LANEKLVDELLLFGKLDLPADGVKDQSVTADRHLFNCPLDLLLVIKILLNQFLILLAHLLLVDLARG